MADKHPLLKKNGSPQFGGARKNGNGNGRHGRKVWEFGFQFNLKNVFLGLFIAFILFSMLGNLGDKVSNLVEKPLSTVITDVREGKIEKIEIEDSRLTVYYKDGGRFLSHKEPQESLLKVFEGAGVDPKAVEIKVKDLSPGQVWLGLVSNVLPLILTVVFFLFLFRQARGAQDNIFSFGQSRARVFQKDLPKVTFSDVAGVDEAKGELAEVVDFLKNPTKYKQLGARTPKGVILVGPSGTGKTLLAKAMAGEARTAFYSVAGSEFMEMLVGIGASVTGDTPVLIREDGRVRLVPIGEFVDRFYLSDEADSVVSISGIETLGFERKKTKFWGTQKTAAKSVFAKSMWQPVGGVSRHRVNEIYTIRYLGGQIETTGDHSVFVRQSGWIVPKKVSELASGDILVSLPMNMRRWDVTTRTTAHEIKAHGFDSPYRPAYLPVWDDHRELEEQYAYALSMEGSLSQWQIAREIGVSQATVGNWQRGVYLPQLLSRKLVKLPLPERVAVTPGLLTLFGFYTAEGRSNGNLEFTFGVHEPDVYGECIRLMEDVFGLAPSRAFAREDHSYKIVYYAHQLGRFFERHCGTGAHKKHVPPFLWEMPREHFLAFLKGYSDGDGYTTKDGKLSMSSVSQQLIRELAWLCSMHGIKTGVKEEVLPAGRRIAPHQKPLPEGRYWSLIIGKTSNPFTEGIARSFAMKRAIVKKIERRSFDGYVYDLCGVTNEAFFGGEKPILLHNSRVRDLFAQAKKNAPSIIFIDEIDAIGRMRSVGLMGGHDEREQTLNQILVEMDGFEPNTACLVVAATNRGDLLDPALIRPGRFDRRIVLDLPDMAGRKDILAIHAKGKPFAATLDWDKVAKRTVGFSGADLENMLNEAAILAARENKKEIDYEDIEEAATKVKLGPEKKRLQSDLDRKMTAYHEAGHAVVNYYSPALDPVHRVSIVSRGMALGFTMAPPEKDRLHETRSRLIEEIAMTMGGRAAEQLIFHEMTSGAANDIDQVTRIARYMVMEFGMSDLGPINFGPHLDVTEWGKQYMEQNTISQDMQGKIDSEVKKLIDEGYKKAQEILKKYKKKLDVVAAELVKKETLESEEFAVLMGGEKRRLAAS